MRTDLDHLPEQKRRELERVVQILFDELEQANASATSERRKSGRIEKIILYGSYARGGWVDEPHTAKGYQSDFDLLVIVNSAEMKDGRYWEAAETRFTVERSITKTLHTPVNFIVHTAQEVNDGLAHGRFFFMDVRRDGIALYSADDSDLPEPVPKSAAQAQAMAMEYFDEWITLATASQKGFLFYLSQNEPRHAAFTLHQATEQLYHCVLLVSTFYTPHVHNLAFLRSRAESIDARLTAVWPTGTRHERALFEKLKEAYVKARYSKHFRISVEHLRWLGQRVDDLGRVVEAICTERLAELQKAVD